MENGEEVIIRVDIDRTLCDWKRDERGKKVAIPKQDVISKVNRLYREGHRIVIWTSRNNISRRDQTAFTTGQLRKWGVKYHELDMKKPLFDLFVDDKAVNVDHWMKGIPIPGMDYNE